MADDFTSDQSSPGPVFRWRLIYRVKTEPVFVPPPPPAPWTQWTQWPDQVPTRRKPVVDFRPWSFVPSPVQVFSPYRPWDDFTRRKPGLSPHLQSFTARSPGTIIGTTISLTMAARETKADGTLLAVYVIQSQPAVTTVVSIQEAGVI